MARTVHARSPQRSTSNDHSGTDQTRNRSIVDLIRYGVQRPYANRLVMQVTETLDLGAKVNGLTPRQIQCLQLVYQRRTSKEIATELGLSAATIDTYITDAVGILGARNSRHAAEILHAAIPPREFGSRSSGDELSTTPPQELPGKPFRLSEWLLVRQLGAFGNDVHPAIRILFIPVGAVLIAIGFGALASGARVVSDLFAVWLR